MNKTWQSKPIDEGGVTHSVMPRQVTVSDPAAGDGLIKVARNRPYGRLRCLSEFDPASMLRRRSSAT